MTTLLRLPFRSLVLSLFSIVLLTSCSKATSESQNVGQNLPELKLEYLANEASVVGKPAIVEFWATWCPPCRQSIPHLNGVYAKYKDRGLVIVGITNEDRATVEDFMKKLPMHYTVARDASGGLAKKFGVRGIPHAMVVDKTGKIVWEGHPMDLDSAGIEKILQ